MNSRTTRRFRELLAALPAHVRQQARDAYQLFRQQGIGRIGRVNRGIADIHRGIAGEWIAHADCLAKRPVPLLLLQP